MMPTRLSLFLSAWLLGIGGWLLSTPLHAASPAEETAASPLRVLLVTGGCCHDYTKQIELIRGLDSRLGAIAWTVAQYDDQRNTKPDIYNDPDWAQPYDLVMHNECFGGVEDGAFVSQIVEGHVKAGVPAVAIHCTMHSYRAASTADTWRAFLGVTSRRHERAKRSLHVVPVAPEHPIMASFPKAWDTPNGELYIIEKVWPTAHVLAQTFSNEEEREMPVVWTNEYEGVRLFGTTLGHHNETIADPIWMETVTAGIRWALAEKAAEKAAK